MFKFNWSPHIGPARSSNHAPGHSELPYTVVQLGNLGGVFVLSGALFIELFLPRFYRLLLSLDRRVTRGSPAF